MGKTNIVKPKKKKEMKGDEHRKLIHEHSVIDAETGEILVETSYKDRSDNGKDWVIMEKLTAYLFALNREGFTLSDMRVYMYIVAQIDYKARFATTKTDIAEKLHLSRQQVDSSIKTLKKYDLIKEAKSYGATVFVINPTYIRRGRNKAELAKVYESLPSDIVALLEDTPF